jgi:pyruvate dehydrogenase E2 component (dihydrolipoamide acetyltransferase)
VQEITASHAGILHHVANEGARLQVESLLGYILAPGETPPGVISEALVGGTAAIYHDGTPAGKAQSSQLRIAITPIARRLAREHNVDLSTISGTGPEGRIVEADVRAAIERSPRDQHWQPTVARRVKLSPMRQRIGERLRQTVQTAVSLTLTREIRAEAIMAARAASSEQLGFRVAYDAFFIKLLAAALRQFPRLNAIVEGQELVEFSDINVGFAVAVDGGLIVPVIRGADSLAFADVAAKIHELSAKAVQGTLTPLESAGGTATVTNLGAYHVDAFTPILNGTQAVILGIGSIRQQPVVDNGMVVPGAAIVLSLTFDHRVTDGAPAAQLLDLIAQTMCDPAQLARVCS